MTIFTNQFHEISHVVNLYGIIFGLVPVQGTKMSFSYFSTGDATFSINSDHFTCRSTSTKLPRPPLLELKPALSVSPAKSTKPHSAQVSVSTAKMHQSQSRVLLARSPFLATQPSKMAQNSRSKQNRTAAKFPSPAIPPVAPSSRFRFLHHLISPSRESHITSQP